MTGFCVLNSACQSEKEVKYEQYVITGKTLYELHCANCHGKNGEGLRELYPSLDKSSRLNDIAFVTCLIKNGSHEAVETKMPANKELYNIDIAQLITYLNSRWGSTKTITETEEVAKVRCER